jgi:alkanesulfonate monooxygenase SsuD/methylene tetrahydromethanopterin reductase-like flavin-dependent oxidoreductase (luciferase family)
MTFRFGVQLAPDSEQIEQLRRLARLADQEDLDLLGVQDHPYAAGQIDAFSFLTTVLAETSRISVFPDVASLPLRGPAILGKAALSLDRLSGGRFDLGLGAGAFWPAIASMGGPQRTFSEARSALEESVAIIRAMWEKPGERLSFAGQYHHLDGARSGPAPSRRMGIWFGSVGPKANEQTGRLADGWAAPIPHYLPYEKWRLTQDLISSSAVDAGRNPSDITRIAQLVGDITDLPASNLQLRGEVPIRTSAADWAQILADLGHETGFDTFIYWPQAADETQLLRWARDVVPAARDLLAKR